MSTQVSVSVWLTPWEALLIIYKQYNTHKKHVMLVLSWCGWLSSWWQSCWCRLPRRLWWTWWLSVAMVIMGPSIYDVHTEGEGFWLRWTPVDWRGVRAMWTSTQKIRAYWRHPVFFSCKEVGGFL